MAKILIGWILALSFITFIVYGADKRKAKKGSYRTPEKVLLGLSFLGGALGAIFGMNLFRHKTKHWYFWVVNVLSLIIHVAILGYVILF